MKINLREIPVYWINADTATDRAKTIEETLNRCGFERNIRYTATMHENKVIGCALSHIMALSQIEDDLFILMEDDVLETEWLNMEIEIPDDFDAFYLGTSYWPNDIQRSKMSLLTSNTQKKEIENGIYKISHMTGLHAVLYRNNNYKKEAAIRMYEWLRNPNGNLHCDVPTAELQAKYSVYAPSHPFFYQSDKNNPANEFWTKKPLCEFE